ncbi:galactose mutarotase-like domain-containing protein [Cercophora newfieldiana]|uniref:Glucose-6-phosphate 1-epimerase n=1 Tax=Cercophora newfieldiana TaxID=92897 RepID=A0AA40CZI4_9PEZI|nr:galactose mutarotase-like domain-containing protein [Cercophora newfieldiana]
MVGRPNRPSALSATPGLAPQPQVTFSDDNSRVSAVLPTGESVTVLLYGATVTSWTDATGAEKLWLSSAAHLDGTKAVRGGIPLVFPVFGTAPDHAQTGKLPQHGFARTSRWEFLGKSTSESAGGSGAADLTAKLDFGLSAAGLDEAARKLWPFAFNLIYSVNLNRESLTTSLVVTNDDDKAFDCQVLMHTYLRVKDISNVEVLGLESAEYVDKVDGAKTKTQAAAVTITGETDRVYTPAGEAVTVVEGGKKTYSVTRDNLSNVVVWNPWTDKAAGMGDFEPKDGYKNMLCIEPGSVSGWQSLEPGDAYEGAQTITYYS